MKQVKIFGARQKVHHAELVEKFLCQIVKDPPKSGKKLEQKKYEFSAKEQIPTIQNRDLIVVARLRDYKLPSGLENLLKKRSVRTISGVSPIGILTKPYPCPGRCVYCPTEDRMPKSYMSNQPAAARAVRNKFHPYKQVFNRLTALQESGHPTSKLEIIVMGGTWSFLPHKYQSWYIKKCFDAANEFGMTESQKKAYRKKTTTLKKSQDWNETADHRIIGLTLETRPDFINERELVRMRRYGCTRIEIGVQTLDDEVQRLTKRGHDRRHVIKAMKWMKDFGFKICWHLMPGLPGTTLEKDLKWMEEVFTNPDFCPDFVKIYPCVVLETAELKEWWEDGKYEPYRDAELVKLLTQFQIFVPEWTRIMRLMRDIPVSNILDGAKFSNLRQILQNQPEKLKEIVGEDFYQKHNLKEKSYIFRDIRAREIGFADLQKHPQLKECKLKIVRRDYQASEGLETFLSFEDETEEHLFALLRLRKPSDQKFHHFRSVFHKAAFIREVHSYGGEISVGKGEGLGQHRGLGKKLIAEAERITKEEWKLNRITIIAGIGTREYYKKWGYECVSTYMTKKLS